MMQSVFILEHECPDGSGTFYCDHYKRIGVYQTEAEAQAILEKVKDMPGFRDYPDGFILGEVILGRTSWLEGFGESKTH